jgi:hypothetical protein
MEVIDCLQPQAKAIADDCGRARNVVAVLCQLIDSSIRLNLLAF